MKIYENEKQELVIDKDETVTYVGENSCVFGSFWTIKGKQYRYIHADPREIDGCHIMFDIETGNSVFIYLKGMPKEMQEFYDKLDKNTSESNKLWKQTLSVLAFILIFAALLIYVNIAFK